MHKVLFVPSKSMFPQSCVRSGGSMVGLMATSSKRAYAIPRSTACRAHAPTTVHCLPVPLQETLKHSFDSVPVGSLCPCLHRFLWALLIAQFRLKLKKVGKTTRSFRYELNQIPYNYTVEVTNRFKGLDLIDGVPEELWAEVCDIVQVAWSRPSPRKRNAKRQNGSLRRP